MPDQTFEKQSKTEQTLDAWGNTTLLKEYNFEAATRPLPDFAYIDRELRRDKHVTLQLLWDEYRAVHPNGYSYSRFCRLFERAREMLP